MTAGDHVGIVAEMAKPAPVRFAPGVRAQTLQLASVVTTDPPGPRTVSGIIAGGALTWGRS